MITSDFNPTHERIARKAECLQWLGENTDAVIAFLLKHDIRGALFRECQFLQLYTKSCYVDTLEHSDWLVEGEDRKLRFYTDAEHRVMYQPIEGKYSLAMYDD